MKKIKIIILFAALACVCSASAFSSGVCSASAFSSEFSVLLDKAKQDYANGNLSSAITALDSARKIIDSEQLEKSGGGYIEVTNWDVVQLKKDSYVGKKIKFRTRFLGVSGSERIWLSGPNFCNFSETLIDKILSLKEYGTYTFYGTVKDGYSSPEFFVEKIE